MQSWTRVWALAALALASTARSSSVARLREPDVHPVVNVISLLQGLTEKVKQQGQAEEVTYARFETWCSTSTKTLESAVASGKETITVLESAILAKTKAEATLTTQITELTSEISKYEAAGLAADGARTAAANLYAQADQDLADTIAAIDVALTALQSTSANVEASFTQAKLGRLLQMPLVLERLSSAQRLALASHGRSGAVAAAPASAPPPMYKDLFARGDYSKHAKTYDFKSDSVVELLKELKTKFEDDRLEGTKAETNSLNAYNLAKSARDNAIQVSTDAKGEKNTLLGETQEQFLRDKQALDDTQQTLEADETNLDDTTKACRRKESEWTERTSIREHELQAMAAAIDILAKVTGVRTEAPTNPVLPTSPLDSSFLEAGVGSPSPSPSRPMPVQAVGADPKQRAVNLLREEARAAHSRSFEQFAEEVAAALGGPFDAVNNMIQKMIFRLMAEQKDEDDHKNWCDLEIGKTNTSKSDKTEKIGMLTVKIEASKASVQQMVNDVKVANEVIAQLTAHMAEASEIRQTGKAENKAAVKDAVDAQAAIVKAISVLEAFYKDTGMMKKEAWELLQQPVTLPVKLPETPSTWSSSYTGVADPVVDQPAGVVAVLKAVSADFARMEADTKAQEETDQKAYDEEIKSCQIEKARRSKEAEMKDQERKRLLDKVDSMEKSLKHVEDELGAVEQYWKDLGPACMEGDSSYEARKASRSSEVAALKQAQVILANAFEGVGTAPAPAPAAAFLSPVHRRLVGL